MKRVHGLQPEADDPVLHEVATDHGFGQARLPCLVDHMAAILEIRRHEGDELIEAHLDFGAVAWGVLCEDETRAAEGRSAGRALNTPDADAAVTAPLLEYPNRTCSKSIAEFRSQLLQIVETMDIAAQPISRVPKSTSFVRSFLSRPDAC